MSEKGAPDWQRRMRADRWPVSGRLRLGRYRCSQVNGSVLRRGRKRRHGRTLYRLRTVPASCAKKVDADTKMAKTKD